MNLDANDENPNFLRTWREDGFHLDLFDTNRRDSLGKSVLKYRFYDTEFPRDEALGHLIFEGEDFACAPSHAVDSDATVASLLSFLSLREGDTDCDYFNSYTTRQRVWRDLRAEALSLLVHVMGERIARKVYAGWLRERLERVNGDFERLEQFCLGSLNGTIHHQYVGRPILSHPPEESESCPICAVERGCSFCEICDEPIEEDHEDPESGLCKFHHESTDAEEKQQ